MRNSNDQYTAVCGSQPSQCLHMCLTLKTNNASTVFSVEGINDWLGCKEFSPPHFLIKQGYCKAKKKRILLHLDVIFNPPSKVLNHKSWLCVWRWFEVWVVLMLLLYLVQQTLVCGLGEAEETQWERKIHDIWQRSPAFFGPQTSLCPTVFLRTGL